MVIGFMGKKISSFQIIIAGFLGLILVGTGLLMLPVAVREGRATLETALFTATSAVCVTGLVVRDTATYWSGFGQAVILGLIQVGGLGIVTVAAMIAMVSGKRFTLFQRRMLQDSFSAHELGGVRRLTGFVLKTAAIVEGAGAVLMLPAFCSRYGIRGIWMAVFHSVSAFCNAGFDVMGQDTGVFSSLTSFAGNAGIVLPICLLIVTGGIGFLTWDDVAQHRFHLRRYRMQSKVVLAATGVLIVAPAVLLFFCEFGGFPLGERVCLALFQAITPRTAGFNTADLAALSGAGRMLLVMLMLIGGSPGSTAGGIKTTTVTVLLANALSVFQQKKNGELFGRRIEDSAVKSAATLLLTYLTLSLVCAGIISALEGLELGPCLFEAVSAIGTVGLSLGLTPSLGLASHLVLAGLMFFGRVGGLTLLYAAIHSRGPDVSQRPVGVITVG